MFRVKRLSLSVLAFSLECHSEENNNIQRLGTHTCYGLTLDTVASIVTFVSITIE